MKGLFIFCVLGLCAVLSWPALGQVASSTTLVYVNARRPQSKRNRACAWVLLDDSAGIAAFENHDDHFRRRMWFLADSGYIEPREPNSFLVFDEGIHYQDLRHLRHIAKVTSIGKYIVNLRGRRQANVGMRPHARLQQRSETFAQCDHIARIHNAEALLISPQAGCPDSSSIR
jgi:hypothetical protein